MTVQFISGAGPAGGGLGDLPGGDPLGGLHPDPAGHLESRQTQKCGLCVKIKLGSGHEKCQEIVTERKILTTKNVLKPCLKCLHAV